MEFSSNNRLFQIVSGSRLYHFLLAFFKKLPGLFVLLLFEFELSGLEANFALETNLRFLDKFGLFNGRFARLFNGHFLHDLLLGFVGCSRNADVSSLHLRPVQPQGQLDAVRVLEIDVAEALANASGRVSNQANSNDVTAN